MTTIIIDLVSCALCWIDPFVSISYILFAFIAIAVGLLQNSFLSDLVSHGKTRVARKREQQQKNGNNSTCSNNALLQALLHSNVCLVPKKIFLHFYVIGLVALTASSAVYFNNKGDNMTTETTTGGLIAIMFLHLLRRCQECLFVHNWTSGSRVHVSVYVVGIIHYILLPHVFLPTSNNGGASPIVELTTTKQQDAVVEQPSTGWMLAALVCLWAQYQQRRHHIILAELRCEKNVKKEEKTYRLPMGGWFQFVSCPHYLAEIIINLCLIAMAILGHDNNDASNSNSSNSIYYRYIYLLAWVVCNLTVSALENQMWYSQNIPNFDKFHRKAIFPFIL